MDYMSSKKTNYFCFFAISGGRVNDNQLLTYTTHALLQKMDLNVQK